MENFAKSDICVYFTAEFKKDKILVTMKYMNIQDMLSLHMIYAGYYEAGKEWCYRSVLSPFSRLYLIDKGEAWIYMNKEKYKLEAGDMFIIPKFTYHTYECEEYMSHYYICFLDQMVGGRSLFEYVHLDYKVKASDFDICLMKRFVELNPRCQITNPDPKKYDNKAELFDFNRQQPALYLRANLESNGILLQLFSRFISSKGIANSSQGCQYKSMNKVFSYIDTHLNGCIHVKELADIMCMSTDHFTRIFKTINGMPPSQYIQLKRIERAQTLMLLSDMSVKEIAEEIGIPNLSQFSKLFRKHVGRSPREYGKNK